MSFYDIAFLALRSDDIEFKSSSCDEMMKYFSTDTAIADNGAAIELFADPSYAHKCRIVEPRELPRRRDFAKREGLATLLHSIAHIEYNAIDLALDALYRFRAMPDDFRRDWLEVAVDEIRHFRMIEGILHKLGYSYGDFPVHRSLFDISHMTACDALQRMAVIPRHFEATGLDVNPMIASKLEKVPRSEAIEETLKALGIIYEEEIEHVSKGDRWFRYICEARGLDYEKSFFEILEKYSLVKKRKINVEGRMRAGFKCAELKRLGAESC